MGGSDTGSDSPAEARPGIVLDQLGKNFGALVAVDGLSLTVNRGEIYGLLGPNGAGKTTALRILAGLLMPSHGHAWVDGIRVTDDPERAKRRLGFLTGSAGLYARLTVREVMEHTAALHDLPPSQVTARTILLTGWLDLSEFLDRRCETLSTGQKQRASLARASIHDPPVLVLDEPTSGLDVLASQGLRRFITAERARGKTILMSTHYLAEAELLCDRIGFIHQGRLVAEGTPRALREANAADSLEQAFLRVVGVPD